MAKIQKLTSEEIAKALTQVEGWVLEDDKLFREFKFRDFEEAFAFMTKVARAAEEQDHHPEWFNVYNTVRVHLTTHEASGITVRDFKLARTMNDALPK